MQAACLLEGAGVSTSKLSREQIVDQASVKDWYLYRQAWWVSKIMMGELGSAVKFK